jgi:hypothetical protein
VHICVHSVSIETAGQSTGTAVWHASAGLRSSVAVALVARAIL